MREVIDHLARLARERPTAPALSDDTETLDYATLAERVAGSGEVFSDLAQTVAILAPNGLDWVIADLALAHAGKTMVPLPPFFSPDQLAHIVRDSGAGHILTTPELIPMAEALGVPHSLLGGDATAPLDPATSRADQAKRIIYTSGTTGNPKGVRLGDRQVCASARALSGAVEATADDIYLSVLPFALLLEQIAAIAAPLYSGSHVILAPHAAGALGKGDPGPMIQAFEAANPSVSVMVPALLQGWVAGLSAMGRIAPNNLRFVAVGGAPVPEALTDAAWALGIPAHIGYGLSECCSVVAVNRLRAREAGTCGQPLDGTHVHIEDGEIVITSDTVMDGYLGREDIEDGIWHTGDLGEITDTGALKIIGRKDNVLITPDGRNVSPEWIEAMAATEPSIQRAVLTLVDGVGLALAYIANDNTDLRDMDTRLLAALAEAPSYARPHAFVQIHPHDIASHGLFTPSGEPKRQAIQAFAQSMLGHAAAT